MSTELWKFPLKKRVFDLVAYEWLAKSLSLAEDSRDSRDSYWKHRTNCCSVVIGFQGLTDWIFLWTLRLLCFFSALIGRTSVSIRRIDWDRRGGRNLIEHPWDTGPWAVPLLWLLRLRRPVQTKDARDSLSQGKGIPRQAGDAGDSQRPSQSGILGIPETTAMRCP